MCSRNFGHVYQETRIFTTALFVKDGKPSKCPVNEEKKNAFSVSIHTMEYYIVVKTVE